MVDKKIQDIIIISLLALLLFVPFLGGVHLFDWDEINFAESAREMIQSHNYLTVQINYMPFWEKPPLFIWMQVLSMKVFGINEFAARFPNAIAGMFTLVSIYLIGNRLFNRGFGWLWVLVYAGSILPQMYFRSGIIDPWFNFFIFMGIYFMVLSLHSYPAPKQNGYTFLSAAFIGLAIMTKGPVGLLIFLLTLFVWLLVARRQWKRVFNARFLIIYTVTLIVVGGFWFILQAFNGKGYLIMDFIQYQIRLFSKKDAGHGGFLMYHFVVLFLGVFPASVYSLPAFRKFKDHRVIQNLFRNWMMISFWVVLILFTIVKTKIVHYSSFCYFPLTFLAAYAIMNIIEGKLKYRGWIKFLLLLTAFIEGLVFVVLQIFVTYKDQIIAKGWIKDPFALGNLQAKVHWSGWEFLPGVLLFFGILFFVIVYRKKIATQIIGIFVVTLVFTTVSIYTITPKIEKYSQNAAIEFYKSHDTENCYLLVWGYKSYAQYFYGEIKQENTVTKSNEQRLLKGMVQKPVYVITKNFEAEKFQKEYPDFKLLYRKNGFVFFGRPAGTFNEKIND